MGDVSKYFNREEFACKCGCGFHAVDVFLLEILEIVRVHFGGPVTINSACRCEKHNKAVGGSDGSKHKLGIAADIVVRNTKASAVYAYLNKAYPDALGLGKYNSFTHIDVASGRDRRW